MRHPFERWLAEQDLSEEARSLLDEGVDAFMTNAFRAAFIMSYLGFMTVLRDRLLRADMPEGFTRSKWSTKIAKIRNSEIWDGEVFTCVQQKTPEVFALPEDLRLQVQFYKDRRNDCAHGKQNGMGYELVETFWSASPTNRKVVTDGNYPQLKLGVIAYRTASTVDLRTIPDVPVHTEATTRNPASSDDGAIL